MVERTIERIKKTSEVFTPEWLVDEMLMRLCEQDETLFTDPNKTFLEPACGNGNFLVRILHWKISLFQAKNPGFDVPIECILKSIYGIDRMDGNVKEAHRRMIEVIINKLNIRDEDMIENFQNILSTNIVRGDSLTWDYENWCANDASRIEQDTDGIISLNTTILESSDEEILAAMRSNSKKKKVVPDEIDDLFWNNPAELA